MKLEIFFLAIFVFAKCAAQNEPVDFSNVLKVKKLFYILSQKTPMF